MSDDPNADDGAADGRDDETVDDGTADDGGDRDPFDSFEEYRDREGDPFESLDGDAATGESGDSRDSGERAADSSDGPEPGSRDHRDPFEYGAPRDRTGSDRDGETDERDRGSDPTRARAGDPLADVEVSDEDPFESNASAFERSDVEGIDPDEVWARLTGEGGDAEADSDSESGATIGAGAGSDGLSPGDEDDVAEVSKHAYCEGCEHFSPPPNVTCTHEGTEILEFIDVDTVRVADCPVVAERRELEDDA